MSFVLFLVSYDTVNVNETLTIDDNYVHSNGLWFLVKFGIPCCMVHIS